MTLRHFILYLITILAITACGSQATPAPDPTNEPPTADASSVSEATAEVTPELSALALEGKVVFEQFYEDVSFACSTCHYINSDDRLLGPGLLSIEDRFEEYDIEDDDDLEDYIIASIVNPRDFIVPDDNPYPENIMPITYGDFLTEDELDALVAYILSF